jgi:hypothetical protein
MTRESKYSGGAVLDEVYCHDDRLVFRGQKHEIRLDDFWWKVVPKTGELISWWNPATDEHLPATEVPEGNGWKAIQGRAVMLEKGLSVYAEGSYVDIRMNNLWEDMRARYRVSLDALVLATGRGIVKYSPTGPRRTDLKRPRTDEERMTEAVRNRFKKHWHAVAYEHDLILPGDIGRVLLEELRPTDKAGGRNPNTVYVKGYKNKESMFVKVYDMQEKHGVESVKVEVTLRQDYLERHNLKSPATWEEQPDIQKRIEMTLQSEWAKVFATGKEAIGMLAERVRVPQAELFEFMADTRNTLAQVLARQDAQARDIAAIKRDMEQHERDMEQLKRATGLK